MSNRLPLQTYASDANLCIEELALRLRSGSLALMLGAGASHGFGLPQWWELVRDCAQAVGLPDVVDENTPVDALMTTAGKVEREVGGKPEFREVVRECLYRNSKGDWDFLGEALLIAIGAMMMASRRGSVTEIITFNFDDILERYLRLHGFVGQVVTALPELRSNADVTVYHPHGYLPSDPALGEDGEELIFSRNSFDERLGDRLNVWTETMRDLLMRKVVVFIGLSVQVDLLTGALANLKNLIAPSRGLTGVWLLGPGTPADVDAELIEKNVVPFRFDTYEEYAPFLLGVCQRAAEGM